ncbi:MAG: hypothetical protein IJV96_07990 [Clostridia bacterium]|nr:hypothetical protein [Clostridia bacterium]
MLFSKYDLYDLYAVINAARRVGDASFHKNLFAALDAMFLDEVNAIISESNRIRIALREVPGIDRESFGFVFTSNRYVYAQGPVTHPLCSRVLENAVRELSRCAESGNAERLSDLCAALCRIPLFFAEGMRGVRLRLAMRRACAPFSRKYGEQLYRAIRR